MTEYKLRIFTDNEKENQELNEIYRFLDEKTKKEIDGLEKPEFKLSVLKILSNPEIMETYQEMNLKNKKKIDEMKIRDRMMILNQLTKKEKEILATKPILKGEDEKKINIQQQEQSIPEEILMQEDLEEEAESKNALKPGAPQQAFQQLVRTFYQSNPFVSSSLKNDELEVRFATRGNKYLTKNDYDSVIKKLKSLGFKTTDSNGEYRLTVQNEFLDRNTGKFIMDRNTRTEIHGLSAIQNYCKTNNIHDVMKAFPNSVKITKKEWVLDEKKNKLFPVNFDDFHFRVSYQVENNNPKSRNFILQNWSKTKKTFRYINRVTFQHEDQPILVDLSIVKMSEKDKKFYTLEESDVFHHPEIYEIELEVDNKKIGPGTAFNSDHLLLESLRKTIKVVLSGLQGTNYPISYPEQGQILASYMKLIHKENYKPEKPVYPNNFIGPSSFTLQMENIEPINENSNLPNIRKDFTVTDKADGERHLMYVSDDGRIYLINTSMNVIFTGSKTLNVEAFHSLMDGELIYHNKKGQFINLYAAFDFYYLKGNDIRSYPFFPGKDQSSSEKSRYHLLKKIIQGLKPISVMVETTQKSTDPMKKVKDSISPIRIQCKDFYPRTIIESGNTNTNIFSACNDIISKVRNDLFEYNTDGLIFTPAFLGVGSDEVGKAGPLSKITWNYSFKWKPPQYNTIDFLVSTVKAVNGTDVMKPIFEEGINLHISTQLSEYKTIQLKCTYSEKKHGTIYLNPCQDVIEDKLPEYKVVNYEDKNTNDAQPMQFYPVKPYDPSAGICNIMLRNDDNNTKQMFTEENEVFEDNTIVEFSYDFTKEEGWRWTPLRLRHDKTSELRRGIKNFGNAYHVANSNWKSIHHPITEEMITSGINIPEMTVEDDIYYNTISGNYRTQAMKDFHNLYVKKILIKSVSKKGDTLIDYACGKAGDLPKWIHSHLSFVFGIDISKDNLENRLDGACVRYLESRKRNKNMPYALFVNGNSAFNIQSGAAMLNDKAIQITKAVFGSGSKKEDELGAGVARQFGVGKDGFQVSSIQFAIHYFFENPDLLQGFMRNISECTKIGGYFIGTTYDGKTIFQLLKKKQPGETIQIVEQDKKIWEITKGYQSSIFEDNSSSIGYRIDVFQESINQVISEYLVNYDYLLRIMEDYGFTLIDREEAKELGLPEGSGLFSELFLSMLEEIKRNDQKKKDYGKASTMNSFEKKISFLNRYFIFKKRRDVNTSKVQLDLGEYDEFSEEKNRKDTKKAEEIEEEVAEKVKPKIRKLKKKIILNESSVPTPDDNNIQLDDNKIVEPQDNKVEPLENKNKKSAISKKPKKKLIIIEHEE
jgi:hypothetical protein